MKSILSVVLSLFCLTAIAQNEWQGKFKQIDQKLPTPNQYRTGSGEPGPDYWQQKADYKIKVELDDENQKITGSEEITYFNNSPNTLKYLWVQLDQNVRQQNNLGTQTRGSGRIPDATTSISTTQAQRALGDTGFDGGFKLMAVKDANGNDLKHTVNYTMMKIHLPQPLKSGESYTFNIDWWYNVNDRGLIGGRSGYEYFKEDDNYLYTIAQWYPRMAVYDDFNGWQNKQFVGSGEFALTFGDFEVEITVPSDHIVASTGELQNPKDVLTKQELNRFNEAKNTYDEPVIIVTQAEAEAKESKRSKKKSTWVYHAENVRDFAFASSRKFIWDAMAVKVGEKTPLAMSYYPKEGNPLWERESTLAVKNTLVNFSEFTIDYPYPVAISVHAASIGMEYPMICFNFGRPRPDGTYDDFIKTRMIFVIVHEVGHNYFPMIINSDERQWGWMDEGLDSFLEYMTMNRFYPDLPYSSNSPESIIPYMKGSKEYMRPIMTAHDLLTQPGPEAYSKPAAALVILREHVMGPELFDQAFKEYAERWAFKHPKPADFFRTMEDASAVDLDWFWNGWFYTTDNVDVEVANVKWMRIKGENKSLEGQVTAQEGSLGNSGDTEGNPFYGQPQELELSDAQVRGEYRGEIPNEEIKQRFAGKNVYQVTFKNNGGLATPIIVEWTYKDGSKEIETVPAEIWRYNESEVNKIFVKDKEVANVAFDPYKKLSDVNAENDVFPRVNSEDERFDKFKKDGN